MRFSKHIAAMFYATYLAWGGFAIAVGEAESWMPAILLIPVIAILALYGIGGHLTHIAGLIISPLVVVVGVGQFFVFGYLLVEYSTTDWSFVLWGLATVVAGALTFSAIREGRSHHAQ